MPALARPLAALLLLGACAAPSTVPAPPPDDDPSPTRPAPPPETTTPPSPATSPPTAAPTATPATAPPTAPASPTAPPDPASLSGSVMSREASPGVPRSFTARVAAVEHTAGLWTFALAEAATTHTLEVHAPAALPPPLRVDDSVQARVEPTGGGPNMRYALTFETPKGELLLAVNAAPAAWKVTRGPAGEVDRGDDYREQTFGVAFEHAGVRATVAADTWARMTVGPATYYVWGSAAQRKLRPGKRAPPDYVAAWLDFAIVRTR